MSQTSYTFDMAKGFAGMKADSRFDHVESMQALESIPVGRAVVKVVGSDTQVRLPRKNNAVITFDADLVTSNVINGKFNGTAISPVTFATDHATTMGLVAAAFAALTGVGSATVTAARVITVVAAEGYDAIVTDVVVTLGASQAGATIALTSNDTFYGVALSTQAIEQDASGVVAYDQYQAVNVLRQGAVFVNVEEAVTSDSSVLMRAYGDGSTTFSGNFRDTADGNNTVAVSGAKYKGTTTGAGVVVVEFNLP